MKVTFFRSPARFRAWLEKHHESARELWVGYYKKRSGKPSITWSESVDEALCFGWIDGIRKTLDESSYTNRFTPRRRGSIWSGINIRRVEALRKTGRVRPAGLAAFEARRENKSGVYSYEQRPTDLDRPYSTIFRKNKAAWAFFEAQPPSYRKKVTWWVISAKQEETRLTRLRRVIDESAKKRRLE